MINEEPFIGWRVWRIHRRHGQVVLQSMNGAFWPTQRPMTATCPRHTAPGEGCACGIYAVTTMARLRDEFTYGGTIAFAVGEVALWGDVIVADWGYKAQFAFPQRLLVDHRRWQLSRELRAAYGCWTELWNPYNWRN
jgi:hypothetical protein